MYVNAVSQACTWNTCIVKPTRSLHPTVARWFGTCVAWSHFARVQGSFFRHFYSITDLTRVASTHYIRHSLHHTVCVCVCAYGQCTLVCQWHGTVDVCGRALPCATGRQSDRHGRGLRVNYCCCCCATARGIGAVQTLSTVTPHAVLSRAHTNLVAWVAQFARCVTLCARVVFAAVPSPFGALARL